MLRTTILQAAQVMGGRTLSGSTDSTSSAIGVEGVVVDSRMVKGGELFFALDGDVTDGHNFIAQAFLRGAAAVVVHRPESVTEALESEEVQALGEQGELAQRAIVVVDTLAALTALASWWRQQCGTPIIGITGSVGKTTIKEMTARILISAGKRITFSKKSYNNHVGVPLTLLELRLDDEAAVVEMGMNHAGELSALSRCVRPNHVLISVVAPVHIEHFESIDGIVAAKLEILDGMQSGGAVVLNADDARLCGAFEAKQAGGVGSLQPGFFGSPSAVANFAAPAGSVAVEDITTKGLEGCTCVLTFDRERRFEVSLTVPGAHSARNAAAAALAAKIVAPDLSDDSIVSGLARYIPAVMRLQVRDLRDGARIVDDSYNANPTSMKGLLELAAELQREGSRVGLVLGDMLELGSIAQEAHREIGAAVAELQPAFVYGVGEYAQELCGVNSGQNSPYRAKDFSHVDEALAPVLEEKFDVLLVKGSRGISLEKLVNHMTEIRGELPPSQ